MPGAEGQAGGRVRARLAELGLTLYGPHPPHDPLDAVVVWEGVARTSGQLPRIDGELTCQGRLGDTVTVAEGRQAAAVCALNALAVLEVALGSLDRVARVLDGDRVRGLDARFPPAAGGGRRGQRRAGGCVRRRRTPHALGRRGGGAAPGRRGGDRGDGGAAELTTVPGPFVSAWRDDPVRPARAAALASPGDSGRPRGRRPGLASRSAGTGTSGAPIVRCTRGDHSPAQLRSSCERMGPVHGVVPGGCADKRMCDKR